MLRKIITLALAGAITLSMGGAAFADTFSYTPTNGPAAGADGGCSFTKDFVMDEDTNIPAATFTYSVAPGQAVPAGTGTVEVKAGVGTPTIANVVYQAGEQASASMTVTTENGVKTATKTAQVDFSSCSFNEPGIYRYIITEGGTNQGVTNDPVSTRTLDVYVVNTSGSAAVLYTQEEFDDYVAENGSNPTWQVGDVKTPATGPGLAVTSYVFYEGTKTDAPSATAQNASNKSTGYTNTYNSYNLEFGKEVKGNFGSLDQYFAFTVTIGNIPEGTVIDVDLSDADATPHESAATKVTTQANPATLTAGEDGITQVFYIHDGQYIKLLGLPKDATYSVVENAHDYTATAGISAADNDEGVAHTDPTSGTIGTKIGTAEYQDVLTGYTNEKDVVTPAGVSDMVTAVVPGIGVAVIAVLGIILMSKKRRNNA